MLEIIRRHPQNMQSGMEEMIGYRNAGVDRTTTLIALATRQLPITRSIWAGWELYDGRSLAGADLGRPLTTFDKFNRLGTIAVDAATLAIPGAVARMARGSFSPLPGSYLNTKLSVNMRGAPAGSATNAAGFARNGPWFWRQMLNEHPEMFSDLNKALIKRGRSPLIDDTWIRSNPTHQSFKGDRLIHHHINQGSRACALPEIVHRVWSRIFHP
jgi:hypothetical protein